MEQITIKIEGNLLEQMKDRMMKKECKNLSQCARELIELALRIEKAASLEDGSNDENDLLSDLIDLFKSNLIWSLETRFLMRFLIENWEDIDSKQPINFMEKAKERAEFVVMNLMKNKKSA